jgi:hypothetical protein
MPITTKSDFWQDNYNPLVNRNPLRRAIFRLMRRQRVDRALQNALNGAAVGAVASSTRKRVAANPTENGGVRTIETLTEISRVTTAADKTDRDDSVAEDSRITTPNNGAGSWPA